MKYTKLVMLGVLTSSLYASGFYGGVDIGGTFINTKTDAICKLMDIEGDGALSKKFTRIKFNPGAFIGYKINSEANGGVELSFNAMFNHATCMIKDIKNSEENEGVSSNTIYDKLYLKVKEKISTTIKGFISHKFKNVEVYIAAGLKVKNMKYICSEEAKANKWTMTHSIKQNPSKTHFIPVICCGINIPFKDTWFARCEYTFDFPKKISLEVEPYQFTGAGGSSNGCKTIKHHTHTVRFGVGKMF